MSWNEFGHPPTGAAACAGAAVPATHPKATVAAVAKVTPSRFTEFPLSACRSWNADRGKPRDGFQAPAVRMEARLRFQWGVCRLDSPFVVTANSRQRLTKHTCRLRRPRSHRWSVPAGASRRIKLRLGQRAGMSPDAGGTKERLPPFCVAFVFVWVKNAGRGRHQPTATGRRSGSLRDPDRKAIGSQLLRLGLEPAVRDDVSFTEATP
jgi:hypothetical protein